MEVYAVNMAVYTLVNKRFTEVFWVNSYNCNYRHYCQLNSKRNLSDSVRDRAKQKHMTLVALPPKPPLVRAPPQAPVI